MGNKMIHGASGIVMWFRVTFVTLLCFTAVMCFQTVSCYSLSSANIPLDSSVYTYLDKLAGFGLIQSDFQGIKPFSKAEAARLLLEAEQNLALLSGDTPTIVKDLIIRLRELIPREIYFRENPNTKAQFIDFNPVSSLRVRHVYLDGLPRNYARKVHDPGGDGVFGIGSGLRPNTPYPTLVTQQGTEGTPLVENNNGAIYRDGYNGELRWAVEGYMAKLFSGVLEPALLYSRSESSAKLKLNRGYIKVGGGGLELEFGRDENWLGVGYRGAITLTNNAENFTLVKLSSPEPFKVPYVGDMKFTLIGSRFDRTVTDGLVRQPWFYAMKFSAKPTKNIEIGINLGRQVGGTGVRNGVGDTLRGLIGGTSADNSNGLAGVELRFRIPWLRDTELYGEFSGEDTAAFWPIVESYVAGFHVPRLTEDGRNDLRFEFFQGNQILYTNGTFPEGYVYKNMPIGHSRGGATQEFYARFSHWFTVRGTMALEYFYTTRGKTGLLLGQKVEEKHAGRISFGFPIYGDIDARMLFGMEKINNLNLVEGMRRTNQVAFFELKYRY